MFYYTNNPQQNFRVIKRFGGGAFSKINKMLKKMFSAFCPAEFDKRCQLFLGKENERSVRKMRMGKCHFS